ncbi:MAG: hypothetical protein ABI425_00715 [Patescibacteria group bacterium]
MSATEKECLFCGLSQCIVLEQISGYKTAASKLARIEETHSICTDPKIQLLRTELVSKRNANSTGSTKPTEQNPSTDTRPPFKLVKQSRFDAESTSDNRGFPTIHLGKNKTVPSNIQRKSEVVPLKVILDLTNEGDIETYLSREKIDPNSRVSNSIRALVRARVSCRGVMTPLKQKQYDQNVTQTLAELDKVIANVVQLHFKRILKLADEE